MKRIVWFNGRSKSGKTTLATNLVNILRSSGRMVIHFDEDPKFCVNDDFIVNGKEIVVMSFCIVDKEMVKEIVDETMFVYLWASNEACTHRGCENDNAIVSIEPYNIAIDTEHMSIEASINAVMKTLFKQEDAYDVFRERISTQYSSPRFNSNSPSKG